MQKGANMTHNISLRRFLPKSQPVKRKQWLKALSLSETLSVITTTFVCITFQTMTSPRNHNYMLEHVFLSPKKRASVQCQVPSKHPAPKRQLFHTPSVSPIPSSSHEDEFP